MDITVDGKPIKAVALPTKQGYLYVFDRITGKPVGRSSEKTGPEGRRTGRMVRADPAVPHASLPPTRAPA